MKKSLVAVGVIVALGAAWGVASWQTGIKIEERFESELAKANTLLAKQFPDADLVITSKDYKRGVFTSNVTLILDSKKDGEEIILANTISHGPIPVSQLKSFNLSPNLAAVNSVLVDNETLKPVFDKTNGVSPISTDIRVSYSQDYDIDLNIIELNIPSDGINSPEINFSGAAINVKVDKDLNNISSKGNSKSLTIKEGSDNLILTGLDFNSDLARKDSYEFYLGNQKASVKEFTFKRGNEDVSVKNLVLNSDSDLKDNKLSGSADYSLDSLMVKGMDFGSMVLKGNVKNIDAKAAENVVNIYQEIYGDDYSSISDDKYSALEAEFKANMAALTAHKPSFEIAPFSWKNSAGESKITFELGFNTLTADSIKALKTANFENSLAIVFEKIGLDININKAMLTEFANNALVSQGYPADQAKKEVTDGIAQMSSMGQAMEIIKADDKSMSLTLNYAANKINYNGKEYTVKDFITKYDQFGMLSSYDDNSGYPSYEEENQIEEPQEAQDAIGAQ